MRANATPVLDRLHEALNRHDLDRSVDCFVPDYRSVQPAHPDRSFVGREQARKNWATFFAGVPDLHADLLAAAESEGTVWAEWHWHGTREDRTALDMRGVTLFGVKDDRIAWGRLYMEEAETAGADIDATMRNLATGSPSEGR